MSHHGMPFLIINYGSEMIFILEQRLHAQNVSVEKSHKVLQDVAKSMFAPQLVQELMRPQDLYSVAATREVFDRLAQSSIMRLSENSMDKLYDLMTMGCKLQLFSCRYPKELVELTMNHLSAVKRAVGPAGADVIANAEEQLARTFGNFSSGQLADVRHQLLTFFQGKRVKVSLFLQEKLQNPDSTFNLARGGPVSVDPPTQPVGTIKYYDQGVLALTEAFPHPDAAIVAPPVVDNRNPFDPAARTSKLGFNVYMTERKKGPDDGSSAPAAVAAPRPVPAAAPSSSTGPAAAAAAAAAPSAGGSASPLGRSKQMSSFRRYSQAGPAAPLSGNAAALNSLSAMIIGNSVPKETVRINLFDDPNDDVAGAGAAYSSGAQVIEIGRVSRDDMMRTNNELMDVISGFRDAPAVAAGGGGGQDLLDLMDDA